MFLSPQIARFKGPTWGPSGSCRPQVGPMLAPWTLPSGSLLERLSSVVFTFNLYASASFCPQAAPLVQPKPPLMLGHGWIVTLHPREWSDSITYPFINSYIKAPGCSSIAFRAIYYFFIECTPDKSQSDIPGCIIYVVWQRERYIFGQLLN